MSLCLLSLVSPACHVFSLCVSLTSFIPHPLFLSALSCLSIICLVKFMCLKLGLCLCGSCLILIVLMYFSVYSVLFPLSPYVKFVSVASTLLITPVCILSLSHLVFCLKSLFTWHSDVKVVFHSFFHMLLICETIFIHYLFIYSPWKLTFRPLNPNEKWVLNLKSFIWKNVFIFHQISL